MDETIQFLIDRMAEKGLGGIGASDEKVKQNVESKIATGFAESIRAGYLRDGDGGMFVYNGRVFESKDDEVMKKVICEVLGGLKAGGVYQTNSINKILTRLKNDYPFSRDKKFRPSKSIIAFRNCVLDLETMTQHDHNEKYETRIYLDFDYSPRARCDRWMEFLPEVLNDAASIDVLQEFLGFVFVDKDRFSTSAALYLIGEGSNGKGVVYEVMEEILGDNLSTASIAQLCVGNTADYYCDQVNGKLLNLCSDMGSENFSEGGRYKTLVSRESIMVRPIHKSPYKAEDMPLLMANINAMPVTTDNTDGYWRRMKIMSFERKFTAEDADEELPMKLKAEVSGIFNWILEGRQRIIKQKGKFTHSSKMEKIKNNAMKDADSVLSYLTINNYVGKLDETEEGYEERKPLMDLYNGYLDYCKMHGKKQKSSTSFKLSLDRAGFEHKKSLRMGSIISSGYIFHVVTGEKNKEEVAQEDKGYQIMF